MRGTSREKESTLFEAIFEAICQTMRTHENHAEIQQECHGVLKFAYQLSCIADGHIVLQDGVEAIIVAMRTHESHSGVQEASCQFYRRI